MTSFDKVPKFIAVKWPLGPRYDSGRSNESDTSNWVAFKLNSANWYIDRLREVPDAIGAASFDSLVGVEMALDGALSSLSSAADCAMGAVIRIFRMRLGLKVLEDRKNTWAICQQSLENFTKANSDPPVQDVLESLRDALRVDGDDPIGFLAILQRLRNRTVHQNSLARNRHIGLGDSRSDVLFQLAIPGPDGGHTEDPVLYLGRAHAEVRTLCESLISICAGYPDPQVRTGLNASTPPASGSGVAMPPTVEGASDLS